MNKEQRLPWKWRNLFLIRHGESTANEINRFAGAVDVPLTRLGEDQARRAAREWSGALPDMVYVSPLIRARRTLDLLFPAQPGVPRKIDARIVERDFGRMSLQNKAYVQRDIGLLGYEAALYDELEDSPLEQGESFVAFKSRVLSFLKEELHPRLSAGQRVLVVAHKYVIELLARLILRLPPENGHDLRLPNAHIIPAEQLRSHFRREWRWANLARDWIVLRHAGLLLLACLSGLILGAYTEWSVAPWFSLLLLLTATGISLARVDLTRLPTASIRDSISWWRLLLRFTLLPISLILAPAGGNAGHLALLLAAPAATTVVTLSRCNGGLILPAAAQTVVSALLGALAVPLLSLHLAPDEILLVSAVWIGVTAAAIFLPMLVVAALRLRHPIQTAHFGEHHGAWAVVTLCVFVLLACQKIQLDTFFASGWPAVATGTALRLFSLMLARRKEMYGVDDYLGGAFPNVFVVVVVADILRLPELAATAVWFLLPMFLLTPLDEWLCRRWLYPAQEACLTRFLRIEGTEAGMLIHAPDSAPVPWRGRGPDPHP